VPPPSRTYADLRVRLEAFGPRSLPSARLYAALIVLSGTVVFLVASALPDQKFGPVELVCTLALTSVAAALLVLPTARTPVLCLLAPLVGIVAIVVLDIGSQDAGTDGQIFFCLPVLFAATQLRVAGGVLVAAGSVAGEGVVVLWLLPVGEALTDLAHVGTMLSLFALVLIRAGVVQDRLVAQLRQQAAIDPLTGLVTRRVLDEATQSAITGAEGQAGTSLVMIDVDRFKVLNDTYGHVVGDDALGHLARLLSATCRAQDVVARMGGDEIAVLMPGCGYDVAVRRAEEFVALVRDNPLLLPDGTSIALSISAGAAHVPQRGGHPRALYTSADAALYVAKRGGRGRVGETVEPVAGSVDSA
jgi:diguanylate cyclase (GGDEF)-like protein